MLSKPRSPWIRSFSVILVMLASGRGVCDDPAEQVFARIVENWRWSHYWFGRTGIDDVYVDGKKVSALIFWTKNDRRPIRGLCSTDISLCVAYVGVYLDPRERRMQIVPKLDPEQAFISFVNSGFRDSSHIIAIEGLSLADFHFEEKSITLAPMDPPSSILNRAVPEEASREAKRVERLLACWGSRIEKRPRGCSGTLVFAYYGDSDPYWYVFRSCSTACEFKGESVEELARGDWGWEARAGGFIGSPKAEVERLKQQIEKAELFRVEF